MIFGLVSFAAGGGPSGGLVNLVLAVLVGAASGGGMFWASTLWSTIKAVKATRSTSDGGVTPTSASVHECHMVRMAGVLGRIRSST